jgi:phosphatidylethanolamine-binding protein (PEBP) family uncharacterized protein
VKSASNRNDTWPWALITVCLLAGSLAGCGGTGSEGSSDGKPASTDERHEPAALATVSVSPGVVVRKERLPRSVVCRNDPTWLPISWKDLPSTTREIIIGVTSLGPPEILSPRQRAYSAEDEYAIAGISPSVDHLGGSLPNGAYVVLSEPGAPICPPPRPGQRFSFTLYALPRGSTFRELMEASSSSEELVTEMSKRIVGLGGFSVRYPSNAPSGA